MFKGTSEKFMQENEAIFNKEKNNVSVVRESLLDCELSTLKNNLADLAESIFFEFGQKEDLDKETLENFLAIIYANAITAKAEVCGKCLGTCSTMTFYLSIGVLDTFKCEAVGNFCGEKLSESIQSIYKKSEETKETETGNILGNTEA